MANRDPKNVKRIIENISKKAAKKVYGGEGGDVEGVKVVDELPETGKDGDLVLVKKEIPTDIDITNVEFDVYGQHGIMTFVDKNKVYASQELLDQKANEFLHNFLGDFLIPSFLFGTLENFNSDIEDGEIIVLNSREEVIGKNIADQGKFFLKIGTIKLGELNFLEMPHYNEESSKLRGTDVVGLIGNSFDFLQNHIEYKNSNITRINYTLSADQQGIITEINSSENVVMAPVYQVLERGEFYDFLDNPEQTAEWKAQAESQGYDTFALVGGFECAPIETEYDYKMYVYYDNQFNEIPSGAEAQSFEDYTFLAAGNFGGTYNSRPIKFKGTDALINYLEKNGIDLTLPFGSISEDSSGNVFSILDRGNDYEPSSGFITMCAENNLDHYRTTAKFYVLGALLDNLISTSDDTILSFLQRNKDAIDEWSNQTEFRADQFSNIEEYGSLLGYCKYHHDIYYSDESRTIYKLVNVKEFLDMFEVVA